MAGTWRMRAREVISEVATHAREEGVTDEKEVIRRVDAAYPFGDRENYPYKVWLEERRNAIALLRGEIPTRPKPRPRAQRPRLGSALVPVPELQVWLRRQGGLA